MYDMLKNMDPPLGFGNKCPNRLAYKKLIRMNMPVDDEGKVNFTTTLFALIRENLNIKMRSGMYQFSEFLENGNKFSADEMDQADDELKETIKNIWPLQAKNMVDLLVPPSDHLNNGKLTVGKIYAGFLILESWRSTRFGQVEPTGIPVRERLLRLLFYLDLTNDTSTKTLICGRKYMLIVYVLAHYRMYNKN